MLEKRYNQLEGRLRQIKSEKLLAYRKRRQHELSLARLSVVLETARNSAELLHNETQKQISGLVNVFIQDIFKSELKIHFIFKSKRCYITFLDAQKNEVPPQNCGAGFIDVVSFALRLTFARLDTPKPSFLLVDDPFVNLKGVRQHERLMELIGQVSKELNIQIIFVSDERADIETIRRNIQTIFYVTKKGITNVF